MELLAVVGAYLLGSLGIVLVALRVEKKLMKDRSLDYARQDEAADRLQENAKLLLDEYRRSSEATINILMGEKQTFAVVNDIHTLVNSEKTAAIQRELNATKRELILLKELGRPKSVIAATQESIQELEDNLKERSTAQAKVDEGHK